jgi:Fic family protein
LDGNGRLGRLLITFMLCERGALREPLLYLSLYLKTHRQQYYELLQAVRERGDWEVWITFFLDGVTETATQAVDAARRLVNLFEVDRKKITDLGRPAASVLRVHEALQRSPLTSVASASKSLGLSVPTVQKSLDHLVGLGIVRETTGKQRRRLYAYAQYMKILDEGAAPLSLP